MTRIAINGFGRIGRGVFKAGVGKKGFEVVGINDLTDTKTLAFLLSHDTAYGKWNVPVSYTDKALIVNGKQIPVYAEKDPAVLPWGKSNVDVVLECTGRFRDYDKASAHLKAGAKRVILSAPADDKKIPTHVIGLNEKGAGKKSKIINNASCTTNCIAPVMAVLKEKFGIRKAMMTTVHAYTADQVLQDGPHKDLRRARAAAENIIPTTTGAAIAVAEVITSLRGKFDGISIRVPMNVVSISDITAVTRKKTTIEEINKVLKQAAKTKHWEGILTVTDQPIVSSDVKGEPASCIVDLALTNVIDGDLIKVVAWYDNEMGYSHRLAEMALEVGKNI